MSIYKDRNIYRSAVDSDDLSAFNVSIKETDMMIMADRDLSEEAYDIVLRHRLSLEKYIRENDSFAEAMLPVGIGPAAPVIVLKMADAASRAGVGPMAAVAGAMAECVGEEMSKMSETVIIENGGDVFVKSPRERIIGIYAGLGKGEFDLGLRVDASAHPVGVCTSSGVIGRSYSAGKARSATILAVSTSLADAAATALGNRLKKEEDIQGALEWAGSIEELAGAVAVFDQKIGVWGDIDLVYLEKGEIKK